jgi:hypothetical protein
VPEFASLFGCEIADQIRKRDAHRVADHGVERGVLRRRHFVVPVGTGAQSVSALEEPVEEVLGRRVDDDAREVLAADDVHVVDAEVGRHRLVADRTVRPLPFDDDGRPVSQRITRVQERAAVHPGSDEQITVQPVAPRVAQAPPGCVVDVAQRGRLHVEGRYEVVGAAHPQPGDDLGDRRLDLDHVRSARPYVRKPASGTSEWPPAAYLRSRS